MIDTRDIFIIQQSGFFYFFNCFIVAVYRPKKKKKGLVFILPSCINENLEHFAVKNNVAKNYMVHMLFLPCEYIHGTYP